LALTLSGPAYAHTTLGNLNGSGPSFRSNDHQLNPANTFGTAHVPGPLGYVWPGSGLNSYSGSPGNPPGYQNPFTTYEEPAQALGDSYSPEGAILISTSDHDNVGDLMFAINFSQPCAFFPSPCPLGNTDPKFNFNYTSIAIYIPAPVFDKTGAIVQDGFEPAGGINWDGGDNTNIVTTITDNYGSIFITRADNNDPFGPGSWLLFITAPTNITFAAAHNWSEWYYIRINQIKAPHIAGRYFFKIFLDSHYPVRKQGSLPTLINSTMPMENWPVLLVKGEVDPAIVSGTVRYGDTSNGTLYGRPLNLPGFVKMVGIAANPYTGELIGRGVEARGYFNATSQGHFEVEGVAPGIYDVYASAAGFPEQKVAEKVEIFRGQSFRLDLYLKVGPQIRGQLFSKNFFGPSAWPGQLPVTIVIYDSNTYDQDSIVTYSPMNLTHAPYSSYVYGNTLFSGNRLLPPNTPKRVAFPWEGPVGYYTLTSPPTFKDPFGIFNGVGPAQVWWVDPLSKLDPTTFLGSTASEFVFQFGVKGVYGAPSKFSGMIPQVFATWTSSLKPGLYYVRAFINGYVQTTNDGTRFIDYTIAIPDTGFGRDVFVPMDLVRSPNINVTVHFHDLAGTLQTAPIGGPDPSRFLIVEAFGRDGTLAGFNFTKVSAQSSQATISVNGLGLAGPILTADPRALIKYSLARYRGLYDYGLPTDSYTIRVFMRGYIQALPPANSFEDLDQPTTATISVGTGLAAISTHMYRGGSINLTLYSVDWQRPPNARSWIWANATVSALVYDVASKAFVDVFYFWNAKELQWQLPTQSPSKNSIPWPDWQVNFGPGAGLLETIGSTIIDRFGPDIPSSFSLDESQDLSTTIFLQENFRVGFLWSADSYRTATFRSSLAIYPGVYALNVWTYGYVQDNVAALGDLGNVLVSVGSIGTVADSSIRLITGVNFTIRILFKTEGIFAGIPYNASVRIRVFDDGDTLVAATTLFSDGGSLLPSSRAGWFADGKKLLLQAVPAGTMTLEYSDLAGVVGYVEPSTGGASVRSATLFSPDHGIWGRSFHPGSYTGPWTVMVDVINWYRPKTYHPPVPGLLQGESPFFNPYNHLGPYSQRGYAVIPNAAQSSEASVQFELDQRGYVQGSVHAFDWSQATRTVSWAMLRFNSADKTYFWYTWDGWFDGYLDAGEYDLTVSEWTIRNEGHSAEQLHLVVSAGQSNQALTLTLEESGIPIPELRSLATAMLLVFSFAATALSHLRRRRNPTGRRLHCAL